MTANAEWLRLFADTVEFNGQPDPAAWTVSGRPLTAATLEWLRSLTAEDFDAALTFTPEESSRSSTVATTPPGWCLRSCGNAVYHRCLFELLSRCCLRIGATSSKPRCVRAWRRENVGARCED